jgi:hypothetical protein
MQFDRKGAASTVPKIDNLLVCAPMIALQSWERETEIREWRSSAG